MSSIEFPDNRSVEALLRASVVFKFECPEESEMYVGSPQYAAALRAILDAVVAQHKAAGASGVASRWLDTYDLAASPERSRFVHDYALRHPKWATMDEHQRKAWVDVVAAPYRIKEEDYPKYIE